MKTSYRAVILAVTYMAKMIYTYLGQFQWDKAYILENQSMTQEGIARRAYDTGFVSKPGLAVSQRAITTLT